MKVGDEVWVKTDHMTRNGDVTWEVYHSSPPWTIKEIHSDGSVDVWKLLTWLDLQADKRPRILGLDPSQVTACRQVIEDWVSDYYVQLDNTGDQP